MARIIQMEEAFDSINKHLLQMAVSATVFIELSLRRISTTDNRSS